MTSICIVVNDGEVWCGVVWTCGLVGGGEGVVITPLVPHRDSFTPDIRSIINKFLHSFFSIKILPYVF